MGRGRLASLKPSEANAPPGGERLLQDLLGEVDVEDGASGQQDGRHLVRRQGLHHETNLKIGIPLTVLRIFTEAKICRMNICRRP